MNTECTTCYATTEDGYCYFCDSTPDYSFFWAQMESGDEDTQPIESHWWDEVEDGVCDRCGERTMNGVCVVCHFFEEGGN